MLNQVLVKQCDSDHWVRDPECSIPLRVVKDDKGNIYVRAQVRHFTIFGFFMKSDPIKFPYLEEKLPWGHRRGHSSIVTNNTDGVPIHVYAMRMSQWKVAMKAVEGGAGVKGVEAHFHLDGTAHKEEHAAAKVPQMVTLAGDGSSHRLEVSRVGTGLRHRRKVVVVIATESTETDENGRRKVRVEAMIHLRSNTRLTVTLPAKDGQVQGASAAEGSGGICSQVTAIIQNIVNAKPASPPTSLGSSGATRSHSEANSSTTIDTDSSFSVAPSTATRRTGHGSARRPVSHGATALGDSASDEDEEKVEEKIAPGSCDRSSDEEERSDTPSGAACADRGGLDGSPDKGRQPASPPVDEDEEKVEEKADPGSCDGSSDEAKRSVIPSAAAGADRGGLDGSPATPPVVSANGTSTGHPMIESASADRGRADGSIEDEKQSASPASVGAGPITGTHPREMPQGHPACSSPPVLLGH